MGHDGVRGVADHDRPAEVPRRRQAHLEQRAVDDFPGRRQVFADFGDRPGVLRKAFREQIPPVARFVVRVARLGGDVEQVHLVLGGGHQPGVGRGARELRHRVDKARRLRLGAPARVAGEHRAGLPAERRGSSAGPTWR
ncbi:hypothetical protein [Amycolatopsis minnesotensis]|uniref:hypothetical protein n=1 Tax=Amycolatopsis minnesotensis TaxID=337894 RepID=UPI0031DE66C9